MAISPTQNDAWHPYLNHELDRINEQLSGAKLVIRTLKITQEILEEALENT